MISRSLLTTIFVGLKYFPFYGTVFFNARGIQQLFSFLFAQVQPTISYSELNRTPPPHRSFSILHVGCQFTAGLSIQPTRVSGSVVLELFHDVAPLTSELFSRACNAEGSLVDGLEVNVAGESTGAGARPRRDDIGAASFDQHETLENGLWMARLNSSSRCLNLNTWLPGKEHNSRGTAFAWVHDGMAALRHLADYKQALHWGCLYPGAEADRVVPP